jgi:phytoene dehydrogenase-like protein
MLTRSRGFLKLAMKHTGKTMEQYLAGLKSGRARQILNRLMPPEYSATALIMMLGTRMSGNAGYPVGGASEVTRRMVEKYLALGGSLHLNTKVDEIVVKGSQARGVRANGTFYPSDYVVAACDAYGALKNLLDGRFPHPQLDGMLNSAPLFDPLILVSFGLDRRFDIPYSVTYECPEGIATSPTTTTHALSLRSFDFDPGAAPEGCSSVMAMMEAPFEYWDSLRKSDPGEYKNRKQALSDAVAAALDRRIPGFEASIRIRDVATPATYARLTGVYRASFEGFAPVPASLKANIQRTVPGLAGFRFSGQWATAGGGICTAVYDGKTAAEAIAKELK